MYVYIYIYNTYIYRNVGRDYSQINLKGPTYIHTYIYIYGALKDLCRNPKYVLYGYTDPEKSCGHGTIVRHPEKTARALRITWIKFFRA